MSTDLTPLKPLLLDVDDEEMQQQYKTSDVDVEGDDLLMKKFNSHSKRGKILFYISLVSMIILVVIAMMYNIDLYLDSNNSTTEVTIEVTQDIEMPIIEISLDPFDELEQTSITTTLNDIDIELYKMSCQFYRDSDDKEYTLNINFDYIIANNNIIDDNHLNNSNKYGIFANILNNHNNNISYTAYGYTEYVFAYGLENGDIEYHEQVTIIYYKINQLLINEYMADEYILDKKSKLFDTIKNGYKTSAKNGDNILYIVDLSFNFSAVTTSSTTYFEYIWMTPLFSDSDISTISSNDNNYIDMCYVNFFINSIAVVKNTTKTSKLISDLLQSQYYSVSTIPVSQFIKDGEGSNYWTYYTMNKNSHSDLYYSKFSMINEIKNNRIDLFDIKVDSSTHVTANQFAKYCITRLNNDSYFNYNDSNYVWYEVQYSQSLTIYANPDSFDYKYVTKRIITIWDVLGNTGGTFSIIKVVILTIISFITFGCNCNYRCKQCCKCCQLQCENCCNNCNKWLNIMSEGIAPYQKYDKINRSKLQRYLKENSYCTKVQIDELVQAECQRQIQQLKLTVQKLEAKLQLVN